MHGRLIRIVLSAEGQRFADSTLYCGDTFIARSDVKTESRDSVRPNVLSLSRHVPSRADQTGTRTYEARGAEALDQRTARGRLL